MKWKKLVEREGDFLKNILLHENLERDFQMEFGRKHCDFLTVRKGDIFTHYYDAAGIGEMNEILRSLGISRVLPEGRKRFESLLEFSKRVKLADFKSLTNEKMKVFLNEYFRLYRACYPRFHLAVFAEGLDKDDMGMLSDFRLFGRESFNKAHEHMEPVLSEAAGRLGIQPRELKFLSPVEIAALIDGKDVDVRSAVNNRQNCHLLYMNGKSVLSENETITIEEPSPEAIKGRGTFPASYTGKVRVIEKPDDLGSLNPGDVVICRMTTPDMISRGLEMAGAFVTDEGGSTCHAASLSREFRIPAVFGTGNATKLLKDGDIVEIDAEKGTVKKK